MSAAVQIVTVNSQRATQRRNISCQIPMAANRKTRPVVARLRVPFQDVHERASCLSNTWMCMHAGDTTLVILRIPMDVQRMLIVGEETVEITYSIPWDSYVQDGQMLDGGLCVYTNLYCTIETLVSNSVQRTVVLDDELYLTTTSRFDLAALPGLNETFTMDFECQDYEEMNMDSVDKKTSTLVTVECISPVFLTAAEWQAGEFHRQPLYFAEFFTPKPRKLEWISLFYTGVQIENFHAKIKEHVRDVTALQVCHNDKGRRYASQFWSLCGQDSRFREVIKLLKREAIMTPRVFQLVEAFSDGYVKKIMNDAVGVIDFHPHVSAQMDIRFVDQDVVNVASTQNLSNLCFVLWRHNKIMFCHGICMPALYA